MADEARFLLIAMRVDPAHRDELIAAYQEHGRVAAATEPGLVRFDVHLDEADPNRLYLYEAYADADAHAAHVAGESHRRARGLVDALIAQGKCERAEAIRLRPVYAHPARG